MLQILLFFHLLAVAALFAGTGLEVVAWRTCTARRRSNMFVRRR